MSKKSNNTLEKILQVGFAVLALWFVTTMFYSSESNQKSSTIPHQRPKLTTLPSRADDSYARICKEEWTKRGVLDRSMYNYCVQQEISGYAELKILESKYGKEPWFYDALGYYIDEWTKRGDRQDRMVNFEMQQTIGAFKDIIYFSKQPDYQDTKMERCHNKWYPQLHMVVYCYKEQH